jgi:ribosomal protein S18 acetylase RimI-like enzyme
MQAYYCLIFCVFFVAVQALVVDFRPATPADVLFARKTMLQQAMNPLSISQQTLLVAFDGEHCNEKLVGFGQIRPLTGDYSELASLYVLPEHRKRGIGTFLVRELLRRHDAEKDQAAVVCLLTLRPTIPFYTPHGFKVVQGDEASMPKPLEFEFKAGSVISALLGNELVCMVRQE